MNIQLSFIYLTSNRNLINYSKKACNYDSYFMTFVITMLILKVVYVNKVQPIRFQWGIGMKLIHKIIEDNYVLAVKMV